MHISICACTYRRPDLLLRLLEGIDKQCTGGIFTYSIIIADNDYGETARNAIKEYSFMNVTDITYCVEPKRSISLARNKAIEHAKGEMIAFIDDDEFPPPNWLFSLFQALNEYQVSGVLGPVRPHFDSEPPRWIRNGNFFERPEHPTGYIMPWRECRTGNVLIKQEIVQDLEIPFNPIFGSDGEDIDLFRRLIEAGHKFIWCNEAYVHEVVPPHRWKRSFMVNKALLRGGMALLHPGQKMQSILKSFIAIPVYSMALPLLQFFGHHHFMKYLVKFFDHLGKVLAILGINPVRERKM